MPRPVGYGRPGTAVIPPDWSATHGRVAAATHTATVQIGPVGDNPVFNPELGYSVAPAADSVYDGPAGIAPETTTSREAVTADDVVAIGRYVVSIDRTHAAGITTDHVVLVTACADATLLGRRLTVDAVGHAAEQFETDLHCTLID